MSKSEITDRKSFVDFLTNLRADLKSNPQNWENKSLGDFLEAMARYTEDIQGYYDNNQKEIGERINADTPTWRVFSDILQGARVYE